MSKKVGFGAKPKQKPQDDGIGLMSIPHSMFDDLPDAPDEWYIDMKKLEKPPLAIQIEGMGTKTPYTEEAEKIKKLELAALSNVGSPLVWNAATHEWDVSNKDVEIKKGPDKITFPLEECNTATWYGQPWVKVGLIIDLTPQADERFDEYLQDIQLAAETYLKWMPLRRLNIQKYKKFHIDEQTGARIESNPTQKAINIILRVRDVPTGYYIMSKILQRINLFFHTDFDPAVLENRIELKDGDDPHTLKYLGEFHLKGNDVQ